MQLQSAFSQLFPNKEFNYNVNIKYSAKFKPYNARVRLRANSLEFRLSKEWKDVSEEIVAGLFQVLLLKLFKGKSSTPSIELYHSFLKKLPTFTIAKESDNYLVESFNRVNYKYFTSMIEQPTLAWGQDSKRKLAHYDLHSDTIVMSSIFKDAPMQLLDYVMYHEMLHKKHKFTANGKNCRFHTTAFRQDEAGFENAMDLEKELSKFLRKVKQKDYGLFGWLR